MFDALIYLLVFLLLQTVPALAIEISGQATSLLFVSRDSRVQQGMTDLSRLRLVAESRSEHWSWNITYDHELLWGHLVRDPLFSVQSRAPQPAWLDATATVAQQSSLFWRHLLYRGWVQYEQGQLRITAGRQRIAWGSGRIWNPTDRFNPVDPTALEPDQKLGVDALNGEWNYSAAGSLQLVAAPGKSTSGTSRKLALRWRDTVYDTDISLLAGRTGQEAISGLDLTGDWHDAGWRLEWMQAWQGRGGYGQLSAGLDYTLQHRLFPAGLYLAVEYFYNGAAGRLPANDRLQSRSSQLLGIMAGYDLTPLWRFDLLLINDLNQPGWFIEPAVTWSMASDIAIKCFAQLPGGSAVSEFAPLNPLYAVQADYYF